MGVGDDAAAREAAGLFIVHERLGNADAATTYALHGVGSSSSRNNSNNSRNSNSSGGNGYGGINSSNSRGNSTGAVEQQATRGHQQQQQQQQEPQRLVPVSALRQSFFADLDASSRVNPLRKVTDNKTHGRAAAARGGGGRGVYAHGRRNMSDKDDDEETSMSNSGGSAATSRCNNGDVAATLGTRTLLSCVTSMFVSNSNNNSSSSSSSYDLQRRVVDVLLPMPPPPSSSQSASLPCLAQPAGVVGMSGVSTGYGGAGYAPARESLLSCALRDSHGLLVTASLGVCAGVAGKRVARNVLAGILSGVAVVNVLCVAGYAQVRWGDLLRDAAALVRHPPRLRVPSSNGNSGGSRCDNDVGNAVASEAVGLLRRVRAIVTATTLRRVTFGVAVTCGILW